MKEDERILLLWDKNNRLNFFNDILKDFVERDEHPIDRIFYVYPEIEYENGFTDYEKELRKSCDHFSIEFEPYMIPKSILSQENSSNILAIQNALERLVIPELVKKNPSHLILTIPDGGNLSVNYAIVGLLSINTFEYAFGKNVELYQMHEHES